MRKMEVIATATKSACDAGVHEPLIGIKMLGTLKREFGIVLSFRGVVLLIAYKYHKICFEHAAYIIYTKFFMDVTCPFLFRSG